MNLPVAQNLFHQSIESFSMEASTRGQRIGFTQLYVTLRLRESKNSWEIR
jgi:hypothetical protein